MRRNRSPEECLEVVDKHIDDLTERHADSQEINAWQEVRGLIVAEIERKKARLAKRDAQGDKYANT